MSARIAYFHFGLLAQLILNFLSLRVGVCQCDYFPGQGVVPMRECSMSNINHCYGGEPIEEDAVVEKEMCSPPVCSTSSFTRVTSSEVAQCKETRIPPFFKRAS